MADTTERTIHGFTQEQFDFMREEFGRKAAQGFDRPTQMWLISVLVVLGLAVSAFLWTEIGSVREDLRTEIGSVREDLRTEIGSVREEIRANRDAIAELAKGQARIEAILEERLPRSP